MGIFPPSGYLSLRDARDILMRRMHEGITPSEEIERYRNDGLDAVDATQAMAAAEALRRPPGRLLSGGACPLVMKSYPRCLARQTRAVRSPTKHNNFWASHRPI